MKFLADENVEWPLVLELREAGHDVAAVCEECAGATDEEVLQLANAEGRILLTNDADFGTMVVSQQQIAHGIVLLRFNHEQAAAKGKAIRHLLRHHADKLGGHLTVVSERQIRIRPLQA